MEDIFNSVTVTITYTPSIKVSVKQTSTSDVLFYFYVVNTTYNNKNTILLKYRYLIEYRYYNIDRKVNF